MSASKYYNGVSVINANCPINFSIGTRSAGKSYYFKRYCVKQFLDKGHEFIYLRRTKVELEKTLPSWFLDIGNEFPNYAMEMCEHSIMLKQVDDDGDVISTRCMGYAFSLAEFGKLRSIPFENVMTIFFDEFMPENNRYLKPSDPFYEPQALLSLYMSVARGYKQVVRPDVKIICVANLVTFFNPYFTYFGIDLTEKERGVFNNIYAERFIATGISQEIAETKIGKVLMSTAYGAFALENKSLMDIKANIRKHDKTDYVYGMLYFKKWYTIYMSSTSSRVIIANGFDRTFPNKYKLEDVEGYDSVPWFAGEIYRVFRKVNENGDLYYEDMHIKSIFAGLFLPRITT